MSILLTVGVAHRDAPLAGLERVAVTASAARSALHAKALAAGCTEILVLSTCSRTELHTVVDVPSLDAASGRRLCWSVADRLVGALLGNGENTVGPVSVAVGDDAVRHLFRVAAGLESRIVGETEVGAQLRAAARTAAAEHGEPHRLRRVVAAALAAAGATAAGRPRLLRRGLLAERAVARALAAPDGRTATEAVVVGAGTMGRQIVEALPRDRCRAALLSRSSSARASGGPRVYPLEDLPSRLASADLLFVATSAGRQILPASLVRDVLAPRRARPLTIVDLSLPRNVDPGVVAIEGVRLLDLDDLSDRGSGIAPDPDALAAADAATDAAAEAYCAEIRSRRAGPMIAALRGAVEEVCLDQLRRTTKGIELPEGALARMASAVAGAVAHAPTLLAREAAAGNEKTTLALLAAAFRLDAADGAGSGQVA
jgi:glutamyl-tRNA reductase